MKYCLTGLTLAMGVAISTPVLANGTSPFALSQHILDSSYDFKTDCVRDCHITERKISVEFWNNTITGRDNAKNKLSLTESSQEAARFLTQATFGATARDIHRLKRQIDKAVKKQEKAAKADGQTLDDATKAQIRQDAEKAVFDKWIGQQIKVPSSQLLDLVSSNTDHLQTSAWWHQSITAPDQLRQRVAFALNHIQTISTVGALTKDDAIAEYYDVLVKGSLGDFRELLRDIIYSIGMGVYLDNLANQDKNGKQPNENFARELMQLFALGTERLNLDGSPQLDANGKPIPTYSEQDVVELAKALSGFSRSGKWLGDATLKSKFHYKGEKRLFAGTAQETVFLASNTAEADVTQAIDAIFNHPNVAPFMATRLIQHLVTSNPTPAYVARVASVFNADKNGQRGNMTAVVKAVLLDEEARNPELVIKEMKALESVGQENPPSETFQKFYGKLKEPVLRMTNLLRAFEIDPTNSVASNISSIQRPLYAPSVFSFFQPDDSHAGRIESSDKVAPEFALVSDVNQAIFRNALHKIIFETGYKKKQIYKGQITKIHLVAPDENEASEAKNTRKTKQYEGYLAAKKPAALLDRYNLLLMGGSMDDTMKQKIVDFIKTIPADDGGLERARKALYLVMTSNQQAIQR